MLADYDNELTLCTYCPSLCLHTCPVSTVDGNDAVSPWGKMSLANHARLGHVPLDEGVAAKFYKCLGCGGCRQWCVHSNDVADTLFSARREAVAAGAAPFDRTLFHHDDHPLDGAVFDGARKMSRFVPKPDTLLMPGLRTLEDAPEAALDLLELCGSLEYDLLAVGEASRLDVGYDLWAGGYQRAFEDRARRVQAALARCKQVVVVSPESLYCLREVYPRYGFDLQASLVSVPEFVLPLLSGAVIERMDMKVAYHDSCHLVRQLGVPADRPREILQRVLLSGPLDLVKHGEETVCCGGTGCLPLTSPETSRGAALDVLDQALEVGAEVLTSFSPECVALMRSVAEEQGLALTVEHGVSLVNRALRGTP